MGFIFNNSALRHKPELRIMSNFLTIVAQLKTKQVNLAKILVLCVKHRQTKQMSTRDDEHKIQLNSVLSKHLQKL